MMLPALLIAGASFIGPASKRTASSPEYVYAGVSGGIGRFPIVNGVMSSTPVSTLETTAYGSIAVGPDGSLYVPQETFPGHHWAQIIVDVFAPGAQGNDPPVRQIKTKKQPGLYSYGTIAVDAQGYLYWGMSFPSGIIDVFAPGASGFAKPVASIADFGFYYSIDDAGNLYVASDKSGVDIWSTTQSNPVMTRHLCLLDQAEGVAVDASLNTYVAVTPQIKPKRHPAGIAEFAPNGQDCPKRVKPFQTSPSSAGGQTLAEYEGQLYLSVPGFIYEIPEVGGDPRTPTTIVGGMKGSFLAIGP
jgi:hypothetical protein